MRVVKIVLMNFRTSGLNHRDNKMAKRGRPKKQFCKRGHDTFICGRNTNNSCKDCCKEKRDLLENKAKIKENSRKNYEIHKDEILVRHKQYALEHHKDFAINTSRWRKENPELNALIKLE